MAKAANVDPWHFTASELALLLTPYELPKQEFGVDILKYMMPTDN